MASDKYPNAQIVVSARSIRHRDYAKAGELLKEASWYALQGDIAGVKAVCPFAVDVILGDSTR